jgi:hypothetical protein
MPFRKGLSGNPGGRPKAPREVEAIAREHSAGAIATLVQISSDGTAPPAVLVTAANSLLDRAWGKPTERRQAVDEKGAIVSPKKEFVLVIQHGDSPVSAEQ